MEASLPKKRLIKKLVSKEPVQQVSPDTVSTSPDIMPPLSEVISNRDLPKSPDFFPASPVYCPKSPDFPPPSPYELPPPSPDYSKMSQLELQQFEQPKYRPNSPELPPPRPITPDVSSEKQYRVDAFIQKYKRVEQPREEEPRREVEHRRESREPRRDDHRSSRDDSRYSRERREPRYEADSRDRHRNEPRRDDDRDDSRDSRDRREPRHEPRRDDYRSSRDDDFRRKSDARRANQNEVNQSVSQSQTATSLGEADFHKKSPSPEREISRGNDGARRQPGKNEADRRSQSRSDTIPDHMRGGNRIDTMNQYNGRSAYHEKYQFKPTVTKQQLDKELEEYGKK